MTQIKPNRRVQKTVNKTYKLHQTDIWGALGRVSRDKKITKFVADVNRSQLISELRKYPRNVSKKIKQEILWGNKKGTKNLFLYQLTQAPQKRKSIKKTLRTTILKMRKKLLLFYFAGRIRAKTFRKLSKLYMERSYTSPHNKIGKNKFLSYVNYKAFTLFLEARLDVLFLRVGLLPTMYAIRQALFHRKAKVKGQTPLNKPGFLVKAYREFSGDETYLKYFKPHLLRVKDKKSLDKKFDHPVYIIPSYSLRRFFKLFEPMIDLIKYPFEKASPLVFNFSFNKHNFIKFLIFFYLFTLLFGLDWSKKGTYVKPISTLVENKSQANIMPPKAILNTCNETKAILDAYNKTKKTGFDYESIYELHKKCNFYNPNFSFSNNQMTRALSSFSFYDKENIKDLQTAIKNREVIINNERSEKDGLQNIINGKEMEKNDLQSTIYQKEAENDRLRGIINTNNNNNTTETEKDIIINNLKIENDRLKNINNQLEDTITNKDIIINNQNATNNQLHHTLIEKNTVIDGLKKVKDTFLAFTDKTHDSQEIIVNKVESYVTKETKIKDFYKNYLYCTPNPNKANQVDVEKIKKLHQTAIKELNAYNKEACTFEEKRIYISEQVKRGVPIPKKTVEEMGKEGFKLLEKGENIKRKFAEDIGAENVSAYSKYLKDTYGNGQKDALNSYAENVYGPNAIHSTGFEDILGTIISVFIDLFS